MARGWQQGLRARIASLEQLVYRRLRRVKQRRAARFIAALGLTGRELILDVGCYGGDFWPFLQEQRDFSRATLVGLDLAPGLHVRLPYRYAVIADACALPFAARSVDVVFSNSVLEHVGGPARQQQMAAEVMRIGRSFFLQVPNRWFPIEPHFFIPFFSYLPVSWQMRATQWLFGEAMEIRLPTRRQLAAWFPGCWIERERFFGLTKAFYVWRSGSSERSATASPARNQKSSTTSESPKL